MVTEGILGLMLATMTTSVRQPVSSGRLSLPSSTMLIVPGSKSTSAAGSGTGVSLMTSVALGVTVAGYKPCGDMGLGVGVGVLVGVELGVSVGRRVLVGMGVNVPVAVAVSVGVCVSVGAGVGSGVSVSSQVLYTVEMGSGVSAFPIRTLMIVAISSKATTIRPIFESSSNKARGLGVAGRWRGARSCRERGFA